MKCPHCGVAIHEDFSDTVIRHPGNYSAKGESRETGEEYYLNCRTTTCPECAEIIAYLQRTASIRVIGQRLPDNIIEEFLVWPRNQYRHISENTPDIYAKDYREAAAVISISPAASAALSRRCLQNIIHNEAKIVKRNLKEEIEELTSKPGFPADLSEALDTLREFGNFGAHPINDVQTGSIIDVEPGEAEWMLDVLDMLFDFFFVKPAKLKQKKDLLNAKRKAAGRSQTE